jgi:hypothetical protein
MMKRMLGFAAVCATAGVLTGPDSDINIVALSSAAQDRLSQPALLGDAVGASGGLSFSLRLDIASLSFVVLLIVLYCRGRLMHRKPR